MDRCQGALHLLRLNPQYGSENGFCGEVKELGDPDLTGSGGELASVPQQGEGQLGQMHTRPRYNGRRVGVRNREQASLNAIPSSKRATLFLHRRTKDPKPPRSLRMGWRQEGGPHPRVEHTVPRGKCAALIKQSDVCENKGNSKNSFVWLHFHRPGRLAQSRGGGQSILTPLWMSGSAQPPLLGGIIAFFL